MRRTVSDRSISKEHVSAGISAMRSAQAISHQALQRVQAVDFGIITTACLREMRQAETSSSMVQVMLTMVSMSAAGGLNEGLSESLSLRRKFFDFKLNPKLGVRENAGAAAPQDAKSSGHADFEILT